MTIGTPEPFGAGISDADLARLLRTHAWEMARDGGHDVAVLVVNAAADRIHPRPRSET